MRISLIAAALVALPLLTACGGSDSESNITAADVSKALQDGGLKDTKLADCAADIYVSEGISQDGLRLMIKNDIKSATATDPESLGMTKEDSEKAKNATNRIVGECLK
ncbi:hypothetical protein JK358_01090 [Nocardia sp. 2]|uniref:DUF732 domain-containing protein n=1 Tax=Nocardia acididurans TaxID=2802282 RepID=A0ABS1M1I1_9NOCA|nr:hypothetical protein [Nocardia acididurans]MBL1072983.1 hypothetical protein [Nocardia acididurans]